VYGIVFLFPAVTAIFAFTLMDLWRQ
jgi:hypothetical protein